MSLEKMLDDKTFNDFLDAHQQTVSAYGEWRRAEQRYRDFRIKEAKLRKALPASVQANELEEYLDKYVTNVVKLENMP